MDDVQAIKNLIFTYAELFDAGDWEGFGRLFEHGTFRPAGFDASFEGSEAVAEMIRGSVALYDGSPATKHQITNTLIEIDGDTAAARSYFSVLQARPELPLQPVMAGRYHDRFERIDGRWRYADHVIFLDLIGDVRYLTTIPG